MDHMPILRLVAPRIPYLFGMLLVFFLCIEAVAFGAVDAGTADPRPPSTFLLPTDQLWTHIAGAIVALPTYVINKYAPYTSTAIKGVAHWVTAAIAGGITQAVTAGNVGFNQETLQFVVTAIIASMLIQPWWKKTGIGPALGQGQNIQEDPTR